VYDGLVGNTVIRCSGQLPVPFPIEHLRAHLQDSQAVLRGDIAGDAPSGSSWSGEDSGCSNFLFGLWSTTSNLFAVGGTGTVLEKQNQYRGGWVMV